MSTVSQSKEVRRRGRWKDSLNFDRFRHSSSKATSRSPSPTPTPAQSPAPAQAQPVASGRSNVQPSDATDLPVALANASPNNPTTALSSVPSYDNASTIPDHAMTTSRLWLDAMHELEDSDDSTLRDFHKIVERGNLTELNLGQKLEPSIVEDVSNTLRAMKLDGQVESTTTARFEKVLQTLKTTAPVISAASSLNPFASLGWGVAHFAITLALNHISMRRLCLEQLKEVLRLSTDYMIFERVFNTEESPDTAPFREALKQLYISILRYQMGVVITLKSKSGKFQSAFGGWDSSKLKECQADISAHEKAVKAWTPVIERLHTIKENALLQQNLIALSKTIIDLQKTQNGNIQEVRPDQNSEVLHWISSIMYEDAHNAVKRQPVDGTTDWLLQSQEYQDWLTHDSSAFLWVKGSMGSGKSCLAHEVIEDQQSTQSAANGNDYALLYFYCDASTHDLRSMLESEDAILRCLVKQLAQFFSTNTGIPTSMLHVYNTQHVKGLLTSRACMEILSSRFGTDAELRIILDGLDECAENTQRNICRSFAALLALTGSVTKVFISCRDEGLLAVKLRNLFPAHQSIVDVREHNEEPIKTMIAAVLEQDFEEFSWLYGPDPSKTRARISDVLNDNADGMFRWVRAAFDYLHKAKSFHDLGRRIDLLPSLGVLDNLYQEIWNSLINDLDEPAKASLELLLNLVLLRDSMSEYQPADERTHKWHQCGLYDYIRQALHYLEFRSPSTTEPYESLARRCPAFLVMSRNVDEEVYCTPPLAIPHVSVATFLQTRLVQFGKGAGHARIAELCIDYLVSGSSLPRHAYEEHFAWYAARWWSVHLRMALKAAPLAAHPSRLQSLVETFLGPLNCSRVISRHFRKWEEWVLFEKLPAFRTGYLFYNEPDVELVTIPSSTTFARVYCGLPVGELDNNLHALFAAPLRFHANLGQWHRDAHAHRYYYRRGLVEAATPRMPSASEAHESEQRVEELPKITTKLAPLVQVCLKLDFWRGASTVNPDLYTFSPESLQLYPRACTTVERTKRSSRLYQVSLLSLYALIGKLDCLRGLVEGGADINGRNEFGQTAGHVFCRFAPFDAPLELGFGLDSHVKVLRTMFELGLDPNVKDNQGNTCLFEAIEAEIIDDEVLSLFMAHGADIISAQPDMLRWGPDIEASITPFDFALHISGRCAAFMAPKVLSLLPDNIRRSSAFNAATLHFDTDGLMAQRFFEHGVQPLIADESGRVPLDLYTLMRKRFWKLNDVSRRPYGSPFNIKRLRGIARAAVSAVLGSDTATCQEHWLRLSARQRKRVDYSVDMFCTNEVVEKFMSITGQSYEEYRAKVPHKPKPRGTTIWPRKVFPYLSFTTDSDSGDSDAGTSAEEDECRLAPPSMSKYAGTRASRRASVSSIDVDLDEQLGATIAVSGPGADRSTGDDDEQASPDHETSPPWDPVSGRRLEDWLEVVPILGPGKWPDTPCADGCESQRSNVEAGLTE